MDTARKRRVLFVLFEGLPRTVIDSQVLLHAREMAREGDLAFEIWSFACGRELYRASKARLAEAQDMADCPVRVFRAVWYALPFSILTNALWLALLLVRYRPRCDVVHARGDFTAAVVGYLRPFFPFRLIWDHRGDGEAEFAADYRADALWKKLAKRYKLWSIRWRVKLAAKRCDAAFFVSDALRRRVGGAFGDKPHAIVPCAASRELFFFDPELRRRTRQALGYDEDAQVFIYSGGMALYQCFPETVALFSRLYREDPRRRLLVLTPQHDVAAQALRALPKDSYTLRTAALAEVNGYLNAADAAFLLREADAVNAVAAPTKFAEYCLAGLPVCVTEGVPEYHRMAQREGNLCRIEGDGLRFSPPHDRATLAARYAGLLSREALRARYRPLYLAETAAS